MEFLTFLTCTATIMAYFCDADRLPPPTRPTHEWLDEFTVTASWTWPRPSALPKDCDIRYDVAAPVSKRRLTGKNYTFSCLVEAKHGSDSWTYSIHAVGVQHCEGWNVSEPVSVNVSCRKPRVKLVDDFTCVLDSEGLNCSWVPVDESLNLTVSRRSCGAQEELKKTSTQLNPIYSLGKRKGHYLEYSGQVICFLVDADNGWSYIQPPFVIPSPKLIITEDKGRLKLNWDPPVKMGYCTWKYEFHYTHCNVEVENQEYTLGDKEPPDISYDENCLYKFRSRVQANHCPEISSDWSDFVTYGANKARDGTLTVVAIVIPIILFVSVLLSCYCFRRHRDIICPNIPDPSAIFKEMMMNGNKEFKPAAGNLYTPVPEPVEPWKMTLVSEHSAPQENS